ncbi:putative PEP-binding protein [Streptomyces erythrochromogenes]|uniref:putative PEP-binding protein n=1 Tax=Streptomyces erythrochromogenes TaxID=285574 RepID=UPI003800BFF9
MAYGIARIAASRWPAPVVVRTGDFQTNEYARLLGGRPFEPVEANPMIGWPGGSRYYSDGYREGFALECRALRRKTSGAARTARRRTGPPPNRPATGRAERPHPGPDGPKRSSPPPHDSEGRHHVKALKRTTTESNGEPP